MRSLTKMAKLVVVCVLCLQLFGLVHCDTKKSGDKIDSKKPGDKPDSTKSGTKSAPEPDWSQYKGA